MLEVSIIIPNYNGIEYIENCLRSLKIQVNLSDLEIIVVDNGSTDGSNDLVRRKFPEISMVQLRENFGFCKAVNMGIKAAKAPYVILLNNDTQVHEYFVKELLDGIKRYPKAFSCASLMLNYNNRAVVDDAGDFYCAFGWAYARGKGRNSSEYLKEGKIFASCAGAAIYRKEVFDMIGYFDEDHFAYLEDIDIGYRARIYGYENYYIPTAKVYHVGSGTSGSRYNEFKVKNSSRNNIYLIYKNMPTFQIILNLPFLIAGFIVKTIFFIRIGLGFEYIRGLRTGFKMSERKKKISFKKRNLWNYCKIQKELWENCFKILRKF
ncbi:glycosyltransferase family 2 protein [Anaerosacchariphilus polymeriproducens]|uniref:Glycosyltransferase family 2 protein n=1 Tax=Anaerosacchariphilus polymeriproducens TaxID=1812858 RepID=A0A371ARE4_9FIRM|nr:glycosyltransferase family 2 protein [Anaerosacchariphilus polymeriproducens]RDU22143.1 glycosyltransferase family 2 protein [Anaerosacchariphilus polymeriproducens]